MVRDEEQIGAVAATVRRGSIVAAAGCGKTEQIARAVACSKGCRLILTHTHAGVDALKARLKRSGVGPQNYRIDTIAGWALRFAAAFPQASGLTLRMPANDEWNVVYECATRLVNSGAVANVLAASYVGLFVDEYQDCTIKQHQLVCALASHMPTCLFGDPLQAIFGFKGEKPVNWSADVFGSFPQVGELRTPWRWLNVGNGALATWLDHARHCLETGQPLDLTDAPECVGWAYLPSDTRTQTGRAQRQAAILAACKSVTVLDGERLIVVGDSANVAARVQLAQSLAKIGFTNMEPVSGKDLMQHAATIDSAIGIARLDAVLDFVAACMTGAGRRELTEAVKSHLAGGKRGASKFGHVIPSCVEITRSAAWRPVLDVLETMRLQVETHLYRREMFFSMRGALHMMVTGQHATLPEAVWEAQNRLRHIGRRLGKRSIGSTLLVKGLEFDHAVIIDADRLTRKDLYVAITRPMRTMKILSRSQQLSPRD